MKNNSGMTLIEVLVATFVFVIAFGALLSSVLSSVGLIDLSDEQSVAIIDARNLTEKMYAASFNTLKTLFPNGVQDGSGPNTYNTFLVGGYTLRNEHITVTYTNVNADPLEILITVSWLDKRGRARSMSLTTFRTR